ncbi:MAG: amino acid adenylation domain-containing protein, partial [Lentisphaeraceae bacterium]|nr:amino acid adenylation domain-containing protein [Lentisphaeraceae bacterium]
ILTDGWCTPLVLTEVKERYECEIKGQLYQSTATPAYESFITYLRGQDQQPLKDYWKKHLEGYSSVNTLTIAQAMDGNEKICERVKHQFSEELSQQIQQLAQQQKVSVNTVLQLAWAKILAVYSGNEDVVMGTVVSGRPADLPGVETMLGLFINSIPLRFKFISNETISDALKRLQSLLIESNEQSSLPLTTIQQQSELAGGTQLFDSLFVFENYPLDEGLTSKEFGGLKVESIHYEDQTSFPLVVIFTQGKKIQLELSFDSGIYEYSHLKEMALIFETVLEQMSDGSRDEINDISLLTDKAYQHQVIDWNETAHAYPSDKTVLDLFEEQVAKSPDAIALTFAGEHLTYGELNLRADLLARKLAAELKDVEGDRLVGLYTERSLEMVIAIWATLKAGAAYVPLDCDWPIARVSKVVKTSALKVILTQKRFTEKLSVIEAAQCFELDGSWINETAAADLSLLKPTPTDLIYVIFTSGSTGEPKGVMLEHRGVVNRVLWMREHYGIGSEEVFLQKTPYTFDVSVWEFFLPALSGSRLVCADPEGHKDPSYLARIIESEKVNYIHFVPSMLQIFIDSMTVNEISVTELRFLKKIFASGEALTGKSVASIAGFLPATELHNLYGPTEASVDVSYFDCQGAGKEGIVEIGKAIWNTKLYVLDGKLQPCPVGVEGELYLSGVCLARGYMNRPDLTEKAFVVNPFAAGEAGYERMYKTGDKVKLLANGEIAYIGRFDFQVKLRGLRIELGEIEASLGEYESISQAVVEVRSEQLVAFYQAELTVPEKTLKAYLSKKLPAYMVPVNFVFVEEFTKTGSGKINRRALPEVGFITQEYVAPQNEVEEQLAAIWQNILAVEKVGRYDDFFKLGGHSLKVTRLCSQIRRDFEVELALKKVFELPVLGELAEYINFLKNGDSTCLPSIESLDRSQPLALSFAQERLAFIDQFSGGHDNTYNMPMAVKIHGELNVEALAKSLKTLSQKHEILRTSFAESELKISEQPLELEVQNFIDESIIQRELSEAFDLSQAQLFRVKLFVVSETEHV